MDEELTAFIAANGISGVAQALLLGGEDTTTADRAAFAAWQPWVAFSASRGAEAGREQQS